MCSGEIGYDLWDNCWPDSNSESHSYRWLVPEYLDVVRVHHMLIRLYCHILVGNADSMLAPHR